ncbi:hypothetical protein ASG90_12740 [Nocardioides sp. Soil797]|nr:hypothetical protein ASG90_12740 [Nocardioides sp. Soil797]
MTPDEVAAHASSLLGCRQRGSPGRPTWYVDGRMVVRIEDLVTLTIRMDLDQRERFVTRAPETFGVPPAMEPHMKMQAALDHGNDELIREAITTAHELQRHH